MDDCVIFFSFRFVWEKKGKWNLLFIIVGAKRDESKRLSYTTSSSSNQFISKKNIQ